MPESIYQIEVQVGHGDGLHMRPAMQFVDIASRFHSDVSVSNDKLTVDGKSIMQMTMLAATYGTKLKIVARGTDAKQAVDALKKFFEQLYDQHKKA